MWTCYATVYKYKLKFELYIYICELEANESFQNESKRPYAAVLAPNVPVDVMQAAENLGIDLATKLMEAGAAEILQAAKKQTADEIMRQKAAKEASKLMALSEPAIAWLVNTLIRKLYLIKIMMPSI